MHTAQLGCAAVTHGRFSDLASRARRARVVLADRAYPGGLVAHRVVDWSSAGAVIPDLRVRTIELEPWLQSQGPLYRALADEITDEEIAALDAMLTSEERAVLASADPLGRRVLAVSLAVHHGLGDMAERTGLVAANPPEDVHAMNYHSWNTGGDAGYADMIDCALREAGGPLVGGSRVLDYGCSSGRVVRMLAARLPDVHFAGCDVNEGAINWASAALPGIEFSHQPLRPPLPYSDASFDAAYAISIWSHYAAKPGLEALEELRRILRVGGHALITTHGEAAVRARAANPEHGPAAQAGIATGLYEHGFVFVDSFGADGDWGVVDSGWGASFMTPEWLMSKITPAWSVALYRPGGIEGHQDLYVLRRER